MEAFELFYLEESMGEVQFKKKNSVNDIPLFVTIILGPNLRLNFHVLLGLFSLFALALLQDVL